MKKTLYIKFALFLVCCLMQINNVQATCNNLTSAGQIGYNQSGCAPFDPAVIQNLQSPSGGSNSLEYVWRYKNTSTGNNYQLISGATSSTYDPGPVTETTYYKRYAKRQYCTTYLESNSICVTVTSCCNATINSLVVYNLNNNSNFLTLVNGGSYSLGNFPGNWNLEALVSGSTAESVVFTISGSANSSNTENTVPFRAPGDAIALNLGAGSYTVNIKLYSQDNAGGQKCDEKTIAFTLTPPCTINVNAGTDVSLCTATKILTATTTGASTCSTQVITDCNHPLANSGGWLLDPSYSTVCGDGVGTKLWTQSGNGTSYITLDLGSALPAGTQICANMKLEHCANTGTGYSNAKIQASTSATTGFVNLTASVTFSQTTFQEYCYTLVAPARYIRITDNGNCAFRVDYVKSIIPGTTNSTVTYSWSGPGIVGATNTAAVTVNQPGSYIVTATDCKGCVDADTVVVASCCNLNVDAGTDISSCSASNKVLTATSTGAATCTTQVITDCNHVLANQGGWLLDVPYSLVCGDNLGTKLWTQSGNGTSYITLDMGTTLAAGTQICVNMKLEHCANTGTGYSNALIQASTSAGSGFVNLTSSVTFSHTTFQEYCYNLASSARYIRISDNGNCAFRVDYVKYTIPGTTNSGVTYSWSGPGIVGATNTASITVNQPGSYIVTATDCKGCVDTDTVKYILNQPPNCQITCNNLTICQGASAELCAPAGLSSYLWSNGATTRCITVNAAATYTVTITNSNGCSSTCNATVIVNQPPPCQITCGNLEICQGGSTELCAPSGLASYLWSTGATSRCITVNAAGTYTVTITNSNGCSSTCNATVIVRTPPVCEINCGDLSICTGETTELCAAAGFSSYLWSTGATTRCINVNAGGTYYVTVTNQYGCSSTCNTTVIEHQLPVCEINCGDLSICTGESTELCAAAGFSSYLWSTGATTRCITVNAGGTYYVTVTNQYGCSSTCNTTVIEHQLPVCEINCGDLSICTGESTELCAAAGFASYSWSNGATTRCITVSAGGTYYVTVTNAHGCSSTCNVTVIEHQLPVCEINCGDLSICTGESTELCAAAGFSSYLWSTGATTRCITVNAGGTYYVTVTNQYGCSSTCNTTVIEHQLPVCEINCGDLSICTGESTELCAAAGFSSYLWSTGATTRCITVSAGGTYYVTVTNAHGCSSTCNVTVIEHQLPICEINCGDLSICTGESTELCAAAGFSSYLWSTGATTRCITVNAGGTYYVTVTNQYGCSSTCNTTVVEHELPVCEINCGDLSICTGESTELCAAAGFASYSWSNGATTRCITVSAGGTYYVTVTNQYGCSSTCNTTVIEHQLPVCEINCGDLSICTGESTELCAAAGFSSYLWSTGATTRCITVNAGGTYYVTVTNQYGCSSTCNTTVVEHQLPVCSINGGYACCQGDPMQICVPVSVGAVSYLWSTGATTRCIEVYTTGTYTVTVTGQNGCTSTCDKYVHFYPVPEIIMPQFGQVCDTLSSGIVLSGATPVGGTYSGVGVVNGVFYPALAGLGPHTITYTFSNGHCQSSKSAEITVVECVCIIPSNPVITGITEVCAPAQISYTATGAVGATNYFWSTTPGATIVSGQGTQTIIVSFSTLCQPGQICVVASNACGNADPICTSFTTITKIPVITGGIAGESNGVCAGTTAQYCVAPATNASNYVWTVPANANIISGQGTNCITVELLAGFTSGNITVKAQNCKGYSGTKSLTVRSLPLMPGVITGPVTNLCQATGIVYSVANVTGATSYLWTIPATASFVSGQGTNSIVVDFGANFTTGSITVQTVNACGSSGTRILAVKAKAVTPSTIYGLSSVCASATGVAYSVDAQSGVTYTWSVPAGALVTSGQGTANITVDWGFNQGNVTVVASNACGISPAKSLAVTVINCNRTFAPEAESISQELSVYPNPVQSDLTIEFTTEAESAYTITVTDMIGKVIYSSNLLTTAGSNIRTINVDDFARGLYFVTMKGEGFNKSIKITVE